MADDDGLQASCKHLQPAAHAAAPEDSAAEEEHTGAPGPRLDELHADVVRVILSSVRGSVGALRLSCKSLRRLHDAYVEELAVKGAPDGWPDVARMVSRLRGEGRGDAGSGALEIQPLASLSMRLPTADDDARVVPRNASPALHLNPCT